MRLAAPKVLTPTDSQALNDGHSNWKGAFRDLGALAVAFVGGEGCPKGFHTTGRR